MILFESTEEILVPGFGSLRVSQARKYVVDNMNRAAVFAQKGDWANVQKMSRDVEAFCEALKKYDAKSK